MNGDGKGQRDTELDITDRTHENRYALGKIVNGYAYGSEHPCGHEFSVLGTPLDVFLDVLMGNEEIQNHDQEDTAEEC